MAKKKKQEDIATTKADGEEASIDVNVQVSPYDRLTPTKIKRLEALANQWMGTTTCIAQEKEDIKEHQDEKKRLEESLKSTAQEMADILLGYDDDKQLNFGDDQEGGLQDEKSEEQRSADEEG